MQGSNGSAPLTVVPLNRYTPAQAIKPLLEFAPTAPRSSRWMEFSPPAPRSSRWMEFSPTAK